METATYTKKNIFLYKMTKSKEIGVCTNILPSIQLYLFKMKKSRAFKTKTVCILTQELWFLAGTGFPHLFYGSCALGVPSK